MLKQVNYRNIPVGVNKAEIIGADRRTKFGNPFKMENNTIAERNRVCNEYQQWFHEDEQEEYRNDVIDTFMDAKYIGCWCVTSDPHIRCHTDTIVNYIRNINNEESE